nr:MAG TPA: hypothetical protein [Caudoviricetes sp.]
MTEREAIKELKEDIALYDNEITRLNTSVGTPDRNLIDALEMAIEALENQIATSSELKAYRANEGMPENVYKMGYKFGYKRAIDEYTEYLKEIGKTGTDCWVPCFTPNSWKDDFLTKRNKGGSGI